MISPRTTRAATDGGVQTLLTMPTGSVWKVYEADLAQPCELRPDAETAFASGLQLEDGSVCEAATLQILVPNRKVRPPTLSGLLGDAHAILDFTGARQPARGDVSPGQAHASVRRWNGRSAAPAEFWPGECCGAAAWRDAPLD